MGKKNATVRAKAAESVDLTSLAQQYGCGAVQFSGTDNALYERHLCFDHVVNPKAAGFREQLEAVARSVRDVLSQRWCEHGRHV